MLAQDFYGRKPLVWWVGVVEGRKDPLKIGQLKVRIFGLHTENRSILPTESLPWAQVLHPTTGTKTASTPREGDWVMGYFQDGEAAQSPVIIGVYSGIDTKQANVGGKPYVPPPSGFYDPRTKAEVDAGPTPLRHIEDRKIGEPTIYRRLSYGNLEGTGVKSTNSKLSVACDITSYVKASVCSGKIFLGQLAVALRATINALLLTLGFDGTGVFSKITSELKRILDFIKKIQKFLAEIREALACINSVISLVNQITSFIASLPQRIAEFVKGCISKVISQLYTALTNVLGEVVSGGEFGEFLSTAREVVAATRDTINLGGQVYQDAQSTVRNASAAATNISNLPDALSSNADSAVTDLTSSLKTEIKNNNSALISSTVNSITTLPPSTVNIQRNPTT